MTENLLDEGMRWFGPNDTVSLAEIRQSGARSVFTSLHEIPYGEAWPLELIESRRDEIAAAGLRWHLVESVPVSEAIKTRTGDFDRHIENYKLTLQRLGAAGIPVVVYNFMPVLDWVRTDLHFRLVDGREALLYDPNKFAAFDLFALKRPGAEKEWQEDQKVAAAQFWHSLSDSEHEAFTRQTLDLFPGVRLGLSLDDLRAMLARYADITVVKLKEHMRLFLEAVIPVATEVGVRMALHPDDPPFAILGLPRIVCTENDFVDILRMVDEPANGLCYCTGSLSARADNDLAGMVRRLGSRFNAIHLRSVQRSPDGVFFESNHLEGHGDIPAVMLALLQEQQRRREAGRSDWQLTMRPDHGMMMLDDFKRAPPTCPGYSLTGRMRGLAELRGVMIGLSYLLQFQSSGKQPSV
eukprot:TRINITY_DN10258_c0_g1_i1.p1 TRINITY_DN10258_c0_g1~~TRINITY_DN10258_c0_g1_i1.p1  ORF type:complete len:428 (-),score=80.01 TRINITY_DN10258_c0_g1_i1:77-1306(-)